MYHWWESPELGRDITACTLRQRAKLLHDSPVGGHLGLSKTLGEVRPRFYWIHCRRDVEEWCHRCERGNKYVLTAMDYFRKMARVLCRPEPGSSWCHRRTSVSVLHQVWRTS